MKLSFVVPAYNEEARIAECVRSIKAELARTPLEAEIIVVNNASTDRTAEVAGAIEGVRVVNEPHKGLPRARQAGFVASSGELIANIDADTIMPQGWIARVLKEFARDEKLVALTGPFIYYDLPILSRAITRISYIIGYIGYFVNRFIVRGGSFLQGGNYVARRDAIAKVGGYNTAIAFHGEDVDMAKRLFPLGHVKWTFALPMYASGRRFAHEGVLKTELQYGLSYLSVMLRGKQLTERYADVRETGGTAVPPTTV